MADDRHPSPEEETKRLYGEAEARTARAFENLVSRDSFGELLARVTENTVALTKIGTDIFDLMLRNLRLAGRQDITRLARQLGRTEDKLELLLQQVEKLNDRVEDGEPRAEPPAAKARSGTGRSAARSGTGRSPGANGRGANASQRRPRASGQRRSGGSS